MKGDADILAFHRELVSIPSISGGEAAIQDFVVERLKASLSALAGEPALKTLLIRFPAAAELYENLQYAHAGLCLHDLDRSLKAESMARDLLSRAKRPA